MKPRISYDVDPRNRLIIKNAGRRSGVKRFRQVVYGRFKTDAKNKLYIVFRGRWDITDKNRISYTLNKDIDSGFDFRASFGRVIPREEETCVSNR